MEDIFISYASEDRERARCLADAFAARGWSVWWDRHIVPGEAFDTRIEQALEAAGASAEELKTCWEVDSAPHWSHKPAGFNTPGRPDDDIEDDATRNPPEMLSPAAKRHFNLFRDPFEDDVQGPDDIYLSADQRYIREAMFQACRQGGWLMAVCGEPGSGKGSAPTSRSSTKTSA